jgi:polysaccharide deacetylase family protein (PEP-CTERM system associated)
MLNALTVDLEDWFQVSNLEHLLPYQEWGSSCPRLAENTRRLLELLARAKVRATFFVLGWNAARFPAIVREIKDAGHEIGSHGYAHRLVYQQRPGQFASDLALATDTIGEASGVRPRCYRAPSFSITPRSAWALEILAEMGFEVDSSVFPIFHERYGFRGAPRLPCRVRLNGTAALVEAPPSTVRLAGRNFPFAGGAYFRLLPYWTVRRICRLLNRRGEPIIFYLHPWELDPCIPRFRLSPFRGLRSYVNLHQTEHRLTRLLQDFRFGSLSEALAGGSPLALWDPSEVGLAPRRGQAGPSPVAPRPEVGASR